MNPLTYSRWIPCAVAALVLAATASTASADPETVYSVAHVRRGQEAAFASAAAKAWAIYRRLDVVVPEPHVLAKGSDEKGLPYFVEIFTWRDSATPDHAPAEIKAVWAELEAACEKRDGRPGIDFSEVDLMPARP